LKVDDGRGGISVNNTTVTIINSIPVADAGADQDKQVGENVTLD